MKRLIKGKASPQKRSTVNNHRQMKIFTRDRL
jgi:hypothetical protein